MKFKASLLFFTIVLITQCSFNNYKYTSGDNRDADGKCYALCHIPEKHETISNEYTIYTGDETKEDVDIEYLELSLEPSTTKWVKKKAENCLSADPDDCMVWCMVEVPAKTREIKVLKDTTQSYHFVIETIGEKKFVKTGGHTEHLEVVCDADITKELITRIQDTLRDNGFYKGESSNILDKDTKIALTNFQKFHALPEGQLDFQTLEGLGIVF